MFDKLHNWYATYQAEATWWLIGWLSCATVYCLLEGNYIFALVDGALIYFNYYMWKQHVR